MYQSSQRSVGGLTTCRGWRSDNPHDGVDNSLCPSISPTRVVPTPSELVPMSSDDPFDAVAESYDDAVSHANRISGRSHSFFVAEKARILSSVAARMRGPQSSFADIGCGTGSLHPLMAERGWTVTGVDPSPASIEVARRDNPEGEYFCAGAEHVPLSDATYDLTAAICVFHHVVPLSRSLVAAEMVRVTRPGGVVAVIEHHPGHPYTRHSVAHCPFDDDALLLRRSDSEGLLHNAGAHNVSSRFVSWTPIAHGFNAAIERVAGWLPFGTQYVTFGFVG